MKSHYRNLHRIGTLSLVLAWIVLILGLLWTVAVWLGLSQFGKFLQTNFDQSVGPIPLIATLPTLFFVLLGFLQFYVIGKVLHLLVELDERTATAPAAPPAVVPAAPEAAPEISGELNRQSKLITSNLEATQALQQQVTSLMTRLSGQGSVPAVTVPSTVAVTATPADPT